MDKNIFSFVVNGKKHYMASSIGAAKCIEEWANIAFDMLTITDGEEWEEYRNAHGISPLLSIGEAKKLIESKRKPIKVAFRKFRDGEIIALFPELEEGRGLCASYMHIGQHGAADYLGVIDMTKRATWEEFFELLDELRAIGYDNLQLIKRYTRK